MLPIRVDFYLLSNDSQDARWLFACRLIEKAYLRGHRVFVYCNHPQDAEHLDELLWTFKEESFIPHNLEGEGLSPPPPVHIGYHKEPLGFDDILINLADNPPTFHGRFKRIIELVLNDNTAKERSRRHYCDYRAKQCELYTHSID